MNPLLNRDADTAKIAAWIEANIGKVVRVDLQPRWRPIWFVDAEQDGKILPLCVRGDRVDTIQTFPLDHEMLVQKVMHENGVAVPKVYGWLDDPRSYVMDRIPGVAGVDGLSDDLRRSVMRDYMHELARLHRVPLAACEAAGIMGGRTPAEASRFGIERYHWKFEKLKRRPDPWVAFMLGWIERNPLPEHNRRALVAWDTGQFHQLDGRFMSLIDLELGHIGDPMMDLAAFRMRDTVLHFGDMNELYRWYEEESGEPVDMRAIQHHHLFFTMTNNLSFHVSLAEPTPDSDFMTNTQWINETNRFAAEALAEILEIELPDVEVPEPVVSPWAIPFAHMARTLRNIEVEDEYTQYKLRGLFRLTRHLARADEIGRQIVEANLDDIGELTGARPATWQEGDAALEAFVLADGGVHDRELLLLFNRRHQRAQALNGPAGSAMAHHNTIQPFGGRM